ncbi:MAG: carbohydrate ABC transporter permease [Lachnospiraceae bacterium]|nr:carbohydrate ABC transporter permease [Lachnospiraceae bacterium]
MIENKSLASRIRIVLTYIIIILAGLLCLFPLWNVVAISFSSSWAVVADKVTWYPIDFTLVSYKELFKDNQFWRSFGISVTRVVLSLVINMIIMVLMAYPLSKTEDEFRGRNIYMGLLIIAMLFNGGTIPTYLVVKQYGLLNSVWALVLTGAVPIFNTIMVKNFFVGIPKSLEEAAIIDGANPLQVLVRIFIPCSKPVLATVALFSIVGNWNDYFKGLIYMPKLKNLPLMSYIRDIVINLQQLAESGASAEELASAAQISSDALNSAKIVVAVVPLLIIYPLLQKYLITGITIGSVKE